MPEFIVEHPTRGCYTGFDWDWRQGKQIKVHHFRWSIPRNDPQVKRFRSIKDAEEITSTQKGSYVLEVMKETPFYVRRASDAG